MKNTEIFIDANIIIDVFLQNEIFFEESAKVLQICENGIMNSSLAPHTITNIWFVTRKEMSNIERRAALKELLKFIDVVETGKNELNEAIELTEIEDLEDALQAVCAKKHNAEFIVTRDLSGFKYSPVPAISPAEFIKKFG